MDNAVLKAIGASALGERLTHLSVERAWTPNAAGLEIIRNHTRIKSLSLVFAEAADLEAAAPWRHMLKGATLLQQVNADQLDVLPRELDSLSFGFRPGHHDAR